MNLVTPAAGCAALFLASTLFSHTVALRLLLLLGGIFLVAAEALRARLRGARAPLELVPPLLWPIALWAGWAILSLAWSQDPPLTTKELRNEIGYALAAYWLCWVAAQSPRAPRIVLTTLGLGALALCVTALVETLVPRLGALQLYGGAGGFSSTLVVLYPCMLGWVWFVAARRWHAWLALPLLLLPPFVFAGFLTLNRILWIALAAQTLIIALLVLLRRGRARRARTLVVLGAAIVVAGAGAMLYKVQSVRAEASDPRPALWQAVLHKIEERPLTGHGFGRGMYRHELRKETGNLFLWHSHNLFLDTALQLGWTGLALLLFVFGSTLMLAWRLARSASDVAFACGLVLLPLVAGTMVRNLTDVLLVRQSSLLYWGMVGVLLAWGMKGAGGSSTPLDPPAPPGGRAAQSVR